MTASALKSDRKKCLAAGMDGCISKPKRIEAIKDSGGLQQEDGDWCKRDVSLGHGFGRNGSGGHLLEASTKNQ
jgi:CheY-like chemotaxis protein